MWLVLKKCISPLEKFATMQSGSRCHSKVPFACIIEIIAETICHGYLCVQVINEGASVVDIFGLSKHSE